MQLAALLDRLADEVTGDLRTDTLRTDTQRTDTQRTDTQRTDTLRDDTEPTATQLATGIPCRDNDSELWFADRPVDVEFAKSLCGACPAQTACLAGALERREPWGVWGGELFEGGIVVPRKRPRGRPRKDDPRYTDDPRFVAKGRPAGRAASEVRTGSSAA